MLRNSPNNNISLQSESASAPVLIIGHRRKDLILRRLEEINAQNTVPKVVYLSVDGPRDEIELAIIKDIHFSIENSLEKFNFELKVHLNDINMGIDRHVEHQVTNCLKKHSQIIILEDDVKCAENFYCSMLNGLNLLNQNSERFMFVLGFSPSAYVGRVLLDYKIGSKDNSWRESKYFCAWGWATTREVWNDFKPHIVKEEIEKDLANSTAWRELSRYQRDIWMQRFTRENYDYQIQRYLFQKSKRTLIPNMRIIDNEGFDSLATHTRVRPKVLGRQGISAKTPSELKLYNRRKQIAYDFFDSVVWAGDTWLNVRGRKAGLRSFARKTLFRRDDGKA